MAESYQRLGFDDGEARIVSNDISRLHTSYYHTYAAMVKDDSTTDPGLVPLNPNCPYLGLRVPHRPDAGMSPAPEQRACIPDDGDPECRQALKYMGRLEDIQPQPCPGQYADICSISPGHIDCDFSKCAGRPLRVGLFNDATGLIDATDWQPVRDARHLGRMLRHHLAASAFGRSFALINCQWSELVQVVSPADILPARTPGSDYRKDGVKTGEKSRERRKSRERININIFLEDSVSRAHFYRLLRNSSSVLRDIIYNTSIPATVFDFELMHSVAEKTYLNLKRLFTPNSNKATVGAEEFFTAVKNGGYETLYQEAGCWDDDWKIHLVEPIEGKFRKNAPPTPEERKWMRETKQGRWDKFLVDIQPFLPIIDDFGLTFLSCSVYNSYNHSSNPYDGRKIPRVCFYGQDFVNLIKEYLKKFTADREHAGTPYFALNHVYTAHEQTGRRLVNDDVMLADLLRHAAYLENTVTIVMSDHGTKATRYGYYSGPGRFERFSPFLMFIVPNKVASKLGREKLDGLTHNQKRLVTHQDLHHTIMTLITPNHPSKGLFEAVPLNRTCASLKLDSVVLCKCKGMQKTESNSSTSLVWAAEFALGSINREIQRQYLQSLPTKKSSGTSYTGACQRYTGVEILNPLASVQDGNKTYKFGMVVKPLFLDKYEVFDVEVRFPLAFNGGAEGLWMTHMSRASTYGIYEACRDSTVDVTLCTCDLDATRSKRSKTNQDVSLVLKRPSFKLKPQFTIDLDRPCLLISVKTHRQHYVNGESHDNLLTYEAVNKCINVTYTIGLGIDLLYKARISITEPLITVVYPNTVQFLMTVEKSWKWGKLVPQFEFNRTILG